MSSNPFEIGLRQGAGLIGAQIKNRDARAAKKENNRLIDLSAELSAASTSEIGYLIRDPQTGLFSEGPRFNEDSPVINEYRKRIINLSPAFEQTLKFDGDKQGRYAGEVQLDENTAVPTTDTGNGIKELTLRGTSDADDPVVIVKPGFSKSMSSLALLDLNNDLDPTSVTRSQLAQNVTGQENTERQQKQRDNAILAELRNPQLSREEKTMLLSDYEEAKQEESAILAEPVASKTTEEAAPVFSTGRGSLIRDIKNYSNRKVARQIEGTQKRLEQAEARLEKFDPESNSYKALKNNTIPKLKEQIDNFKGRILEESAVDSELGPANKKGTIPEPEVVLQDAKELKEAFLKELEEGATDEQLETVKQERLNKILKKYNISSLAELAVNDKIKTSEQRVVGLALARQVAVTEGRRLGTTDITKIADNAATVYSQIWGGIMTGDMELTPEKIEELDIKLRKITLDEEKFANTFKTAIENRSEKYQTSIGKIKEYLFTDNDGNSVSAPNSPTKGPNNAKIRSEIGKLAADAKRASRNIRAGTADPSDYEAIDTYKDAVVFLAKVQAYKSRDVGFWTGITEVLFGEPEMGESDLEAQGSFFRIKDVADNDDLDLGNEQYFTKLNMRNLIGDGSSQVFYSILTDPKLQRSLQQIANERGQ